MAESSVTGDRLSHTPPTSQDGDEVTALAPDSRSLLEKEQQKGAKKTVEGSKNKVKFGSVEYYAKYGNKYKKPYVKPEEEKLDGTLRWAWETVQSDE